MKKIIFITGFLFSISTLATEICDTADACRALQSQVDVQLSAFLQAIVPPLGDFVRNTDGTVQSMNADSGNFYCISHGQRLPTARELALYAVSHGAQEISETQIEQVPANPLTEWYTYVDGTDSVGNGDTFWYAFYGYVRPQGDLGNVRLCSSYGELPDHQNVFTFDGTTGLIESSDFVPQLTTCGVRCIGANSAQAPLPQTVVSRAEVCTSIATCRTLRAAIDARLYFLTSHDWPQFSPIPRNADGSVKAMNFGEAKAYCSQQGLRLPSIRELALYATSLGAQGISPQHIAGTDGIAGSDPTGYPDGFWYSAAGYHAPSGDLGNLWFWSSSIRPAYSNSPYALCGINGGISDTDGGSSDLSTALCVTP